MADPWAESRGEEPYPTIKEACISDDVQLLSRTFSAYAVMTTNPNDNNFALLRYACRQCLQHNALATLAYVLSDCGFSTDSIRANDMIPTQELSTRILDVLLSHGWNVNKRNLRVGSTSQPLLWWVLHNEDLVKYCLEHGARVHPEYQSPLQPNFVTKDQLRCSPVLERAAAVATTATFDLLRAHGSPLGWRYLHHAVQAATHPWKIKLKRQHRRPNAAASDAAEGST